MKPSRRSTLESAGALLAVLLAVTLAPAVAQARETEKFKVLSVSGTQTSEENTTYEPSMFGSCSFTERERISFESTKPATAYAFTSKSHGKSRVTWSSKRRFTHNLTVVEVPGKITYSRSATYEQTSYQDPNSGQSEPGCYREVSPVDCQAEVTVPVTLWIGGTSDSEESTYVARDEDPSVLKQLHDECYIAIVETGTDTGLFSRADLFSGKRKRLADSDRTEEPAFQPEGGESVTGFHIDELSMELKRKKMPKG